MHLGAFVDNPLTSKELKRYKLLARRDSFNRKIDRSLEVIRRASQLGSWYLSCSFGKDSIVMLDLVKQVIPDITYLFIDDDVAYTSHDYEIIESFTKNDPYFVRLKWDKVAFMKGTSNLYGGTLHDDMFKCVLSWLQDNPRSGFFVGLRNEESFSRRVSALKLGQIHQYQGGIQKGMMRCVPISDWQLDDIGSYIIERGLPILDIYQKLGFKARSGMFGLSGAECGRVAYLKRFWPQKYEELKALRPEAVYYT